ncbi:hypothetical protein CHARACLAT_028069 [Characodon lateralis]|uniref:Secreted protein n=1 Tax=Characodon lateralis TaxID=208331 RepID=A0ABU7D1Z0_9TELE|nr:hypothetical protein [Characodon lateralis]
MSYILKLVYLVLACAENGETRLLFCLLFGGVSFKVSKGKTRSECNSYQNSHWLPCYWDETICGKLSCLLKLYRCSVQQRIDTCNAADFKQLCQASNMKHQ